MRGIFTLAIFAVVLSVFIPVILSDSTEPFARFEYKLSFKGPFLTQKDGTIPFWEYGGHAIAGDSYIRLTPSMSDKKGHIWSKKVGDFANFRLDVTLKVTGVGRQGGDGMGIWFTEDKPDYNLDKAEVFGGKNNWTGLAVLLDTYDNDAKRDNPKIGAYVSSSKQPLNYQHDTDGIGQDIGHCMRDFRNRPFPVRLRIRYLHKRLTLSVNNGVASEDNDSDYEACFDKEGVDLPAKGYFGVTAATGGVSDDMDVFSFVVHSLTDKSDKGAPGADKASEADRLKYEQEYAEYSKKLRDQIDAIAKSHREATEGHHRPEAGSAGEAAAASPPVEDEAARQYRQIWEEQSKIRSAIHDVSMSLSSAKQDLTAGLAEVTRSVEAARQEVSVVKAAIPASPGGGGGGDAVSSGVRELRDSLARLSEKIDSLASRHADLSERVDRSAKQQLDLQKKRESTGGSAGAAAAAGDGASVNCVTTYGVYCAVIMQTCVLICLGFVYLRKQDAAKKFY